ncbi:MAG: hypothetical protein R3268_11425, partial [Acidiferrobacterales bacterium]|nr:hypothetical protein [Acidiferrobacterales bacterium]
QSKRVVTGSTIWTSVVLAALTLGGGGAFGQAEQLALGEGTPVDQDAGIRVPAGFDAQVFAEGVGRARHIAVRDNGDVYVALRRQTQGSGIAALRDVDGDGRADRLAYFGEHVGTGIAIRGGFLYTRTATFCQLA